MAEDQPGMKGLALYSYIESIQGEIPFGRVLDAGTGPRSLRWLMTLETESCTAVTGSPAHAAKIQRLMGEWQRSQDRQLVGNWANPDFLAGEQFDTVLADYLLGALERLAPFFQTELFRRLRPLTARRLYVTGVEPYVTMRPRDEGGALIWEIGRYRDACLTLLGKARYRECPIAWVIAQLPRAGFQPVASRKFPTAYKEEFVNSQLDVCLPGLERMADQGLGKALIAHGNEIRGRAMDYIERHGALRHGFAYAVAADPV